jgi:hypothetical protein
MKKRFVRKALLVCGIASITGCGNNWCENAPYRETQNKDLFGVLYSNGKYIAAGSAENGRG